MSNTAPHSSLTNLEFWKSIINNFGSQYIVDKIHAGKNPLLAVGWGGGNIKLAVIYTQLPWFERLFLIFLRVRKNEHLYTSELRDSLSPLCSFPTSY